MQARVHPSPLAATQPMSSSPEVVSAATPAASATATGKPINLPARPISTLRSMLRRVMFGLLFVLPIVLTGLIVYYIYITLNDWLIKPVAMLIIPKETALPYWDRIQIYVTTPITLVAVLLLLYFMGYAFQTRLNHWVDWIFSHIPGVSIVYRAIRDASLAMQGPDGLKAIDTVVLVPFPHPGARATGFLMGESEDTETGRPLVCVYIPLALFPPSGYTLVFPREEVTFTKWEPTSPWKLLLSGGLTVPKKIPFPADRKVEPTEQVERV
jgi:uncharacterized membrane protein